MRFSLSCRDVEELLAERGLSVDHVTVWRWVQRYAPELERRLRRHLKPTNDSWRVDSDVRAGERKMGVLDRAVDFSGATIDCLTAKRFLSKALGRENHPEPWVINSDKPAIAVLQPAGDLADKSQHRSVQHLNNVLEQDHRAIKRRINEPAFSLLLGSLLHYRRLRSDSYDSQRPGVRECGGCSRLHSERKRKCVELLEQELKIGLGLGVTRKDDRPVVDARKMNIDDLHLCCAVRVGRCLGHGVGKSGRHGGVFYQRGQTKLF